MTENKAGSTRSQRLIESAREAVEIQHGRREPARLTRYTASQATVDAPPQYVAGRIRQIRDQMSLSQTVFAAALNVSPETVRAWEQGKREPDGATQRLLEVAERHPEVLLECVQPRRPDGLRERAARGSREAFLAALDSVPDVDPMPGDELPKE
jgi:putative transcriptional regulator